MKKEEIVAILLKRIDVKGLLIEDVLKHLIKGALDDVAADSSNIYDDMAIAALYPLVEAAFIKKLDEFLAKLSAKDEA